MLKPLMEKSSIALEAESSHLRLYTRWHLQENYLEL